MSVINVNKRRVDASLILRLEDLNCRPTVNSFLFKWLQPRVCNSRHDNVLGENQRYMI